jgi:hypothetical protein
MGFYPIISFRNNPGVTEEKNENPFGILCPSTKILNGDLRETKHHILDCLV